MLRIIIFLFAFIVFCAASCNQSDSGNKNGKAETQAVVVSENVSKSKLPIHKIKLPEGFKISVYAEGIDGARSMVLGVNGTLFIGTRGSNVYAVSDENKDGYAEKIYTIADGLNSPNGVAFRNGSLYVAEIDKVWRYDNIEANLGNVPKPVLVSDKFPSDKHHGWKYIAFGPDDKLYVPVGAPCNICNEDENKYANIMRMNADGSGLETFAKGIRNTVGFSWHPQTKELWFTDNGRDQMGDNVPGDELNHAPKAGMHFGYPFCHAGNVKDPKYGEKRSCDEFTKPVKVLDAHVASLGMKFYTGNQFPAAYKNQVFIAEHGSWNRSSKIGYRVMLVKMDGDKALGYEPFAQGWLEENGNVWGRPVDVLVMPDGSLLVSDDMAGAVYKISYEK
ncbi:MAG: PQQ-dependent sugar dehydrogenase [Bacteroidia bacterium]